MTKLNSAVSSYTVQKPAASPFSSKGQRTQCLCILRLQSIYLLYLQTDVLEKLKGWHAQVMDVMVDRGACSDSGLVYVQIHKLSGQR